MKAVILAGGGGTRLWPLSIPEKPKQFQRIVSDKTMIEETIDRLDFLDINDIYIAINETQISLLKDILPEFPDKNIIIEPALRDTASCIGLAATIIEKQFPDEVMAVCYADHLIKNKSEFQEKLQVTAKLAEKDNTLNIIEVDAIKPNTNYGYVKVSEKIEEIDGTEIYKFDSFKEKPNYETAKKFVAEKSYLWNTGIYVWKASTILKNYEKLKPDTYEKLKTIQDKLGTSDEEKTINEIYPTLEKISIDYAIMEKADPEDVRIVKANLGWSDIGNWDAIWGELEKCDEGNITRGDVQLINCNNCLVYGDNQKKVATIGLNDIIVVDTPQGLLVCKRYDSKKVKQLKTD